jgi:hypothetical protein
MDICDLIIILLAVCGLVWTFVQATIMDKIGLRPLWEKSPFLKELANCGFCTGTHVGWTYGLICVWLALNNWFLFYVITMPFVGATIGFLYERLMFRLLLDIEKIEEDGKKKVYKWKRFR